MADEQKPWEKYSGGTTGTADPTPWEKYSQSASIPGTEQLGSPPGAPQPTLPPKLATSAPPPNFQQPSIGSRAISNLADSAKNLYTGSMGGFMNDSAGHLDPEGKFQANELVNPIRAVGDFFGGLMHPGEMVANDPLGAAALVGGAGRGIKEGFQGLTRVNPERGLNRIYRPTAADSDFPAITPEAISDVKRFGGKVPQTILGNPKPGNADMAPGGVTDTAVGNIQSQGLEPWLARARNMGVQIPGDEIVAATRKAIPDLMRTRDPQGAARLEQQAQGAFGGKTFTPDQFRDWLKTENGTLQSFYNRSGASQGAAETAGTPTAIEKAQADAMRDTLYRYLDPENEGAGPREIQRRTGQVIGLRNAADRRSNSILGEKPITPLGAMAAPFNAGIRLFRGDPAGAVGALGHPFRGPSDALLTNIYRQAPEGADLPQPPQFTPRGLLEAGPIRMGTPDTSGPVNSIIPPHFGSVSTRLLPAASSGINTSGVIVPPIDMLAARRMAGGPRQLEAPNSGIGVSGNLMPNETEPLTRKLTATPQIAAPEPGSAPINVLPRSTGGAIGPGGTTPLRSAEDPLRLPGVLGGRMLDIIRNLREKE